jgi:hypothetical protein
VLVDVAFAPFFISKMLGQYNYLEDLPSLDPTLYKSLIHLKRYAGDAADLCLDFTISDEVFGEVRVMVSHHQRRSVWGGACDGVSPSATKCSGRCV